MENRQQNRKRTGLLVALALCCILAVGGGVMAWFSTTTSKDNTFVQGGGITEPTEKPTPDPNPDGSGDGDQNKPIKPTEGNIIETEWVDKSGITPGSIVSKNPNIGIGKNSKNAYVFVEVENNVDNANTYFVLGDKWAPVTGEITPFGFDKDVTIPSSKHGRCYTEGLFVYVGDSGKADESGMAMLVAKEDISVYTGEVFDKVYANNKFQGVAGEKTITVKAYLAGASSITEDMGSQEIKDEIVAKAIAWKNS